MRWIPGIWMVSDFMLWGKHQHYGTYVTLLDRQYVIRINSLTTLHMSLMYRFGIGDWTAKSRDMYNLYDPVVRSTVQVYPGGWSAVYAFLDNPGMWNLRSQLLNHWYLGQELYVRVHDPDPNPAKERPPPENLLLCG